MFKGNYDEESLPKLRRMGLPDDYLEFIAATNGGVGLLERIAFIPIWGESFLRFGIFFSILLYHKLVEIPDKEFKVIFSFGLSKSIDGVIRFHLVRAGEYYIPEEFEKMQIVQGVLVIEK